MHWARGNRRHSIHHGGSLWWIPTAGYQGNINRKPADDSHEEESLGQRQSRAGLRTRMVIVAIKFCVIHNRILAACGTERRRSLISVAKPPL
jgi:hypothetical protein